MEMPLVSIVIPTYNSAKYLPETLSSILSQSFQDIEIIIVDDASTDDTREVIQSINSDKIRYTRGILRGIEMAMEAFATIHELTEDKDEQNKLPVLDEENILVITDKN